jgi:hypothetical protein
VEARLRAGHQLAAPSRDTKFQRPCSVTATGLGLAQLIYSPGRTSPQKAVTVFPVNVEIKKTELNPPRELGLRLADAFPGAMDDLVNTVAMRRLRLGIRHSNAYGRPGHAKFVLQFPHCNWRRKDERGQSHNESS